MAGRQLLTYSSGEGAWLSTTRRPSANKYTSKRLCLNPLSRVTINPLLRYKINLLMSLGRNLHVKRK